MKTCQFVVKQSSPADPVAVHHEADGVGPMDVLPEVTALRERIALLVGQRRSVQDLAQLREARGLVVHPDMPEGAEERPQRVLVRDTRGAQALGTDVDREGYVLARELRLPQLAHHATVFLERLPIGKGL